MGLEGVVFYVLYAVFMVVPILLVTISAVYRNRKSSDACMAIETDTAGLGKLTRTHFTPLCSQRNTPVICVVMPEYRRAADIGYARNIDK